MCPALSHHSFEFMTSKVRNALGISRSASLGLIFHCLHQFFVFSSFFESKDGSDACVKDIDHAENEFEFTALRFWTIGYVAAGCIKGAVDVDSL